MTNGLPKLDEKDYPKMPKVKPPRIVCDLLNVKPEIRKGRPPTICDYGRLLQAAKAVVAEADKSGWLNLDFKLEELRQVLKVFE